MLAGAASERTFADERVWNVSAGGDMQDENNWRDNILPGAKDTLRFQTDQTAPIWLSDDMTAVPDWGPWTLFNASAEFALTNSYGEVKTLTLGRAQTQYNGHTIRLTAGNIVLNGDFYEGDSWDHENSLIIDGPNASWSSTGGFCIGSKNYNDSAVITNGATLSGSWITAGRDATEKASNNTIRVTGSGTTATFTDWLTIGAAGANLLEVSDGASFTVKNGARIGSINNDSVNGVYVGDATFRVKDNARATITGGSILVGQHSMSNLLEVVGGGRLVVTNTIHVGSNDGYPNNFMVNFPDYTRSGNMLRVSGENSSVEVHGGGNSGVWVGHERAPDSTLLVENGATFTSEGEFKVGDGNCVTNARVVVRSGAKLTHSIYSFGIGYNTAATNSTLEVDGGEVEINSAMFISGNCGQLVVSNGGVVKANDKLEIGLNGEARNVRFSLSGSDSKVETLPLRIGQNGILAVEVPAKGFTDGEAPIKCRWLDLYNGCRLEVTEARARRPGGRIVLVEAENDITYPADENWTVVLPEGAYLDKTNPKQLAVKLPVYGLTVFIR